MVNDVAFCNLDGTGMHVKVCIYGRRKCIMNRDKIPMGKIAFDDTDWRAGALL